MIIGCLVGYYFHLHYNLNEKLMHENDTGTKTVVDIELNDLGAAKAAAGHNASALHTARRGADGVDTAPVYTVCMGFLMCKCCYEEFQ